MQFMKKMFSNKIFELDYKKYWEERYAFGGNSGVGSYDKLAEFKAYIVNKFASEKNIESVIEFGCGDGNQLKYMEYKKYIGLDISQTAIDKCKKLYQIDINKQFYLYNPAQNSGLLNVRYDMAVCLDVLYHIINDKDYWNTLNDIFKVSNKYVILYTSTTAFINEKYVQGSHVKHRDIMSDLSKITEFEIISMQKQKYPERSSADFIFLERRVACNHLS